jgi:RNA polymerase sigma-70 factor (ECF subfamily)
LREEKVFLETATILSAILSMSQTPDFEEVYEEQADFVYSLSRRLSRGNADAEDLFQEVFLRVHRFLPKFQGGSVRGWLRRIVVNTNSSMKRGKKNQAMAHLDETPGWKDSIPDTEEGPLEVAERADSRQALEKALAELSEDFRTILILREVEDLDYSEIAEVLNVPVGTVRSRLARARMALRKELEVGSCKMSAS